MPWFQSMGDRVPSKVHPKKQRSTYPGNPGKFFHTLHCPQLRHVPVPEPGTGKEEGITRGAIQPTPGAGGEVSFLGHMGCTEEIVYEK